MTPLSVYFITFNEEARLPEALAQARKVSDDIVVVDSGSTDGTLAIAAAAGAKVVHHDWQGFAVQKAFAASLCTHPWVLDLDADEVLSDAVIEEIKCWLSDPRVDAYGGFVMRWVYVSPVPGHPMVFSPDQFIIRLYNRTRAAIQPVPHSNNDRPTVVSGRVGRLKHPVFHKSVISLGQLEAKYCRLSSDQAADYVRSGRKITTLRLVTELPLKFLKYYILDRQYRNGWYGFVVSVISANRNFMRFAKAKETEMLRRISAYTPSE